jgi:lipoprotein-anchoring transpeptidase ErfK/SrfK
VNIRSHRAQRLVVAFAVGVTATLGTAVAALREPQGPPSVAISDGTAPGVRPARLAPPKARVTKRVPKPAQAPAAKAKPPARAPRVRPTQVRRAAPARGCAGLPAVSAAPAWGGYARGSSVTIHDARGGRALRNLPSPTRNHQQLVVGVISHDAQWALVRYNERPNGSVGWVKVSQIDIHEVRYRLVVQRCTHRVTVFEGGRPVFSAPVAVGKARTPTPLTQAYVEYNYRWSNPNGTYGAYSLGVAAFSEVYERFGPGGVGQIAIHGTTARYSVGRSASNGCIRMFNEDVTRLATYAWPGTPVTIVV